MFLLTGKVGGAAARHPWRTIAAWLILIVALFGLKTAFGGQYQDNYALPGAPSQAGADFLQANFPQMSGTDARVVIHAAADRRVAPAVLTEVRGDLARLPGVSAVAPALSSRDGDTALIDVQYSVPVTYFRGASGLDALTRATAPARADGLQVALGGSVPENAVLTSNLTDGIGVLVAVIVLILVLRSLVAAGLPLAVGLAGLGAGTSVTLLLARGMDISTEAPTVAAMVGLGVGIDYALLLVARHVEGLRAGLSPVRAAEQAARTAGSSVLIAGLTVVVSLLGLQLSTLQTYSTIGYATAICVAAVMLAGLTLVPALCALAGSRVLPRRDRPVLAGTGLAGTGLAGTGLGGPRPGDVTEPVRGNVAGDGGARIRSVSGVEAAGRRTRTEAWALWVTRRPALMALASTAVLLALAAPVLGMRTWPDDAGSQPAGNTVRQAYDLVAAGFGAGANAPLLVAVDLTQDHAPAELAARLRALPGVAEVTEPVLSESGRAAVITVQPTTAPSDPATVRLLDQIRADAPRGVLVTGAEAVNADVTARLAGRLWVVIAFVVSLSLLILTALLRAPVNALKAAVLNLLSVGAAYGVVTAIFQTDTGAHLLGLPHGAPVSTWVPMLMFAVLFGLSSDYEVFLLSRVREGWLATGDAREAVVRGLGATARVISSAAAIMVAVFLGFATDPDVTVKTIGVGMAAAVLIDATLIRLVLAPAAMVLLGRAGWWLPGVLARRGPGAAAGRQAPPGDAATPALADSGKPVTTG
jgi:putative drug exporter of the RND superfamily